jgi:serine phosphatase RsbU (regulator of sigma subunit)
MPTLNPRLVVRDAAGNEREVEIHRTPFTLGRQTDNDLVLLDSRISRHHARITQGEEGYVIEDAESRHGTFVNGQQVRSHVLATGDQISLGVADGYQLFFVTDQAMLPKLLEEFDRAKASAAPQLQHLRLLLQMAQRLHTAPALEEVLSTLVDSALQLGNADQGLLFLRDEEGKLSLQIALGRGGVQLNPETVKYSRDIVERVAERGREEVILEDAMGNRSPQETGMVIGAGAHGVVAVPLQKLPVLEMGGETIVQRKPELLGILYLDSRSRATALTGLDRQVLQTLAVEGATVIENARLFRLSREQERIRHEFSLASKIQQSLLPRQLPQSGYFELQALTVPCQTVGGDYFDVVRLPGDRYGIAVADVSGKGLPAAMMAVTVQGAFSAVAAGDPDLEEMFRRVNEFLWERTPGDMYATIFYGVVNPSGLLNFVNAGHLPPLLLTRRGDVRVLESSNFPLGLFAKATFAVDSVQLEPGDQILVFSDGVTEARDAAGEFFGEERLEDVVKQCARESRSDVCARVAAAVRGFVGAAPQADDFTLTLLRYGPPEE